MAIVYRFQSYDIVNDVIKISRRWATREAIERVCGQAICEGAEVDDRYVGHEVDGMAACGFDPQHPPSSDFPNYVR
jgi:hypothetical protein